MARTSSSALSTARPKPLAETFPGSRRGGFVQVHVYDNEGIYSHKVPIYCHPGTLAEDECKQVTLALSSLQL